MDSSKTKVCTKCGEEKGLGEFNRSRAGKYGRRADCKKCHIIYARKYYPKRKEYMKKYREENKARLRVQLKEWKKNHKESCKKYRQKEGEKEKAKVRKNRYAKLLTDAYLRQGICHRSNLRARDITNEMVRIRRAIIKFKRYEKEKKNEQEIPRNQSSCEKSRRCVG